MYFRYTILEIRNRLRFIIALRDFYNCTLAEAKAMVQEVPFAIKPRRRDHHWMQDEDHAEDRRRAAENWLLDWEQDQLSKLVAPYVLARVEFENSPEEKKQRQIQESVEDAHAWYESLSEKDKARVDILRYGGGPMGCPQ